MNESIIREMYFLIISILWGGLILIIYDCLRIFRNLIRHNQFFIAFEDILYWIVCGLLIFQMMYKQNNGIIRAFSILGMFIGMIFYRLILSEFLVASISLLLKKIITFLYQIFNFFLKPFIWLASIFRRKFGHIIKKIKKTIYKPFSLLKKKIKSSKISINDKDHE